MLKRLTIFFKRWKIHILLIFILLLLCGYAWRLLPQLVIRSDGFVHMLNREQMRFWAQKYWMTGIEVGPSIAGAILPKFFGPHVSYYLGFELATILFIDILFYFLVFEITRSKLISFVAALIAGVNYFGNWDAYGPHCYCFFLERVINMPFMLIAFLFLHRYLLKGKNVHFLISLIFYFVGIGLGHVELILTPVFMLYPFWWFTVGTKKRLIRKGIIIATLFLLVSAFITGAQQVTYPNWGPGWTLTEFVLNPVKYDYFHAIPLQLVYWSDYFPLIGHFTVPDALGQFSQKHALTHIPYVFFFYSLVFYLLYKKLKKFRALFLTCLTGVLGIFFLNSYVKLPEIIVPDSNRYLYFPNFFLSIFWAIAIWHFFLRHRGARRVLGVFILILYYLANVAMIKNIMYLNFEWGRSTDALFSYVLQTRNNISPNTLVVVSYPEFWVQEADFFTEQLGRKDVVYMSESKIYDNWNTKVNSFSHVIKINYEKKCRCVRKIQIK